ncbi:MAG: AAA domain-containing protein [Desulfobacteraceae bacterium]|nr:AAA domain-containing protein [Desulfobacteraceae bacterium]
MSNLYVLPNVNVNEFNGILLEYATDGILLTDATGHVLALNKSYSILFDVLPEEVLGRNVEKLAEEGAWSPSLFQRVAQKQETLSVVQTTRHGKRILSTGTPVFDDNQRLRYVLFNDRDMSLQSMLESPTSEPIEVAVHAQSKQEHGIAETEQYTLNGIVIKSAAMKKQLHLALRVAKFPIPVLLTGESGVGKSMIARFIHDQSPRRDGTFVAINCGAIPEQLMESELFGHTKGAFTGASTRGKKGRIEAAHGGTLFLDEISEMPYLLQVKLLQFLETKQIYPVGSTVAVPVDCTVIAATNQHIPSMIRNKTFREDLYYRLNGVPIELPSLRERKEEIPSLAHFFLEQYSARFGISATLTDAACEAMQGLEFKGNVRELSHLIQRLIIVAEQGCIDTDHVREWAEISVRYEISDTGVYSGTLSEQVSQFERDLIRKTVRRCGNQEKAAKELGMHQSTLSRKMQSISAR